jgi:transposase
MYTFVSFCRFVVSSFRRLIVLPLGRAGVAGCRWRRFSATAIQSRHAITIKRHHRNDSTIKRMNDETIPRSKDATAE